MGLLSISFPMPDGNERTEQWIIGLYLCDIFKDLQYKDVDILSFSVLTAQMVTFDVKSV